MITALAITLFLECGSPRSVMVTRDDGTQFRLRAEPAYLAALISFSAQAPAAETRR